MRQTIVISNSMLRSLSACDTQMWLRTQGYAGDALENKRVRCGRDVHQALAAWPRGEKDPVQVFLDAYQPYSKEFLLDKDAYWAENVARILQVFLSANSTVTLPFRFVEIEQQTLLELGRMGDLRFCLTDKADGLVEMKETGDLFVLEYKTVGSLREDILDDYVMDSQITAHVAAARDAGKDVKGVWLILLGINRLPDPTALTPKTQKPISCRVSGHGYQRDCWQLHVRYEMLPLIRSEEDVVTWKRNVMASLQEYEHLLRLPLDKQRQQGIYGKCGSCEFLSFCRGQRRDREVLVRRRRENGVVYSGIYEGEPSLDDLGRGRI